MDNFFGQYLRNGDGYRQCFDGIFEYLARRTDFYDNPEAAEALVLSAFGKHKKSGGEHEVLTETCAKGSNEENVKSSALVATIQPSQLLKSEIQPPLPLVQKNGFDYGQYVWTQSLSGVEISIPLTQPIESSKKLSVTFGSDRLQVFYQGEATSHKKVSLLPRSELENSVKPDDCIWTLVSQKVVEISLVKSKQNEWWNKLFRNDPVEIQSQQFTPESISNLSDLDPETRVTVEKMLREQRAKHLMNSSG